MKSTKKILLTLSAIMPTAVAVAVVSCGKGEKQNEFAKNFVLGNTGTENYNKETKTLDLSKKDIKIIPQGSFSAIALLNLFQKTVAAANPSPEWRAPDGIFDLTTKTINIEKIVLPENLEVIENGAFEGLGLKEIQFSNHTNKLTKIFKNAFANNRLTKINLPQSILEIDKNAFYNNQISEINLKDLTNIKKLSAGVLAKNELKSIDLTNIVTIEESALAMNKFEKLELHNNLKKNFVSEKLFYFSGNNRDNKYQTVELEVKDQELKNFLEEKLRDDSSLNYKIK